MGRVQEVEAQGRAPQVEAEGGRRRGVQAVKNQQGSQRDKQVSKAKRFSKTNLKSQDTEFSMSISFYLSD